MQSQEHCQPPFNPQSQISRCVSSSSGSSLAFCLPFPLTPADSMVSTDPRKVQSGGTTCPCSACYWRMSSSWLIPDRRGSTQGMAGSQPPAGRWEGGDQVFPVGWGDWQRLGDGESGRGSIHTRLCLCEVRVSSELLSVLQISVIAGITSEAGGSRAALPRRGKVEAKDRSICVNPDGAPLDV